MRACRNRSISDKFGLFFMLRETICNLPACIFTVRHGGNAVAADAIRSGRDVVSLLAVVVVNCHHATIVWNDVIESLV